MITVDSHPALGVLLRHSGDGPQHAGAAARPFRVPQRLRLEDRCLPPP